MRNANKLVLGTVQFGCQYGINSAGRPNAEMVADILEGANSYGIKTLDTSSGYGDAEQILGKCIPSADAFHVVSKYPQCKLSVKEAFESSLLRLNTQHLYGYLLHHFCIYEQNPKVWSDFIYLKKEGLVDKIGFSLYSPEELEILLKNKIKFDLLQIPHNIFDRKFDPYLKELSEVGVEIHVRSTFLQGLFFKDRNALPAKLQPLKKYLLQLDDYANEHNLTIAELAMNFNVQNPYFQGVIIGVDNVSQLTSNANSITDIKIDLDIKVIEQELLNPVNWK